MIRKKNYRTAVPSTDGRAGGFTVTPYAPQENTVAAQCIQYPVPGQSLYQTVISYRYIPRRPSPKLTAPEKISTGIQARKGPVISKGKHPLSMNNRTRSKSAGKHTGPLRLKREQSVSAGGQDPQEYQ